MGFHTLPSSWKIIEAEMYGMMPRPKMVACVRSLALNTATWLIMLARLPVPLVETLQLALVDHRQSDPVADPIDGQEEQRQEDLLPQFRNREDNAKFFPHNADPSLFE